MQLPPKTFSHVLKCPKSDVEVIRGLKSRDKTVVVAGMDIKEDGENSNSRVGDQLQRAVHFKIVLLSCAAEPRAGRDPPCTADNWRSKRLLIREEALALTKYTRTSLDCTFLLPLPIDMRRCVRVRNIHEEGQRRRGRNVCGLKQPADDPFRGTCHPCICLLACFFLLFEST
ncbi:hypothetical protein WAI453_006704 [Rhynchosporium graminicola]